MCIISFYYILKFVKGYNLIGNIIKKFEYNIIRKIKILPKKRG
nr:MAG TPA: hypothetical protein [Caudoviricetes sp.]